MHQRVFIVMLSLISIQVFSKSNYEFRHSSSRPLDLNYFCRYWGTCPSWQAEELSTHSILISDQAREYYRFQYEGQETFDYLSSSEEQSEEFLRDVVNFITGRPHEPLGYKKGAKKALFGYVYLEKDGYGHFVKDVYCGFKVRNRVGPGRIPRNSTMNVEHTWPQSKGSKREPFRGDLHHLFPTDSKANSYRGNYIFGEVEVGKAKTPSRKCTISKRGRISHPKSNRRQMVFEPPQDHKGNVARALFYSALRYKKQISPLEEHFLVKWHKEDPVDEAEMKRNDLIQDKQGNRNPFVDFPELVQRIEDF